MIDIKILSWNVARLSYGIRENDKLKHINQIIEKINSINADVIVLTEIPPGKKGCEEFIESLENLCYSGEVTYPNGRDRKGLVLIAEKSADNTSGKITSVKKEIDEDGFLQKKWLERNIENVNIRLIGVHVPLFERCPNHCVNRNGCEWRCGSYCKRYYDIFWGKILCEYNKKRTIIIGDFNGCITFDDYDCSEKKDKKELDDNLIKLSDRKQKGWIDVWLAAQNEDKGKRFTWWSSSNIGRRLDYAFASPDLVSVLSSATAKHLEGIRQIGLSDHSALVIELDDNKLFD